MGGAAGLGVRGRGESDFEVREVVDEDSGGAQSSVKGRARSMYGLDMSEQCWMGVRSRGMVLVRETGAGMEGGGEGVPGPYASLVGGDNVAVEIRRCKARRELVMTGIVSDEAPRRREMLQDAHEKLVPPARNSSKRPTHSIRLGD